MAGRKSTATMELAIGATIIAGVIILVVMLMAWGNSTSLLGRHYRVVVNMTNVGGLKEGAPVKMGGFQIGRV
jgi:phospholipid/cholesterol/gamma-HCH transport system substrate-binding protein